MKSIRFQNYRCFTDTGDIQLRPLTFFVGANSSGKSSALKIFPLLKQSMNVLKKGPILWNGKLVDFKDSKNVIKEGQESMRISFVLSNPNYIRRGLIRNLKFEDDIRVEMEIATLGEHDDFIKEIYIVLYGNNIKIDFQNKGRHSSLNSLSVNDEIFIQDGKPLHSGKIVVEYNSYWMPRLKFLENNRFIQYYSQIVTDKIQNELDLYINQLEVKPKSKNSFLQILDLAPIDKFRETLQSKVPNFPLEEMQKLYNKIIYRSVNDILESINFNLFVTITNEKYCGPLRAASERYYRYQNLAVMDIDADGSNMPMYLKSLDPKKLKELNQWLLDYFGIEIVLASSGEGNFELKIKIGGDVERNLLDVGFGYSEILPILVQIWNAIESLYKVQSTNKNVSLDFIVAMEQPELHLHPRMIMKLAKVLCKCVKNNENINFIIETHSKDLLNKVGELIGDGKMDKELVNIVLFNAKHEGLNNEVESANYSEEGILENWPYGFFYENEDEDAN